MLLNPSCQDDKPRALKRLGPISLAHQARDSHIRGNGVARRALLADAVRAIAFVLWSPCAWAGKQKASGQYELKAAFLFNIARFVEWPPEAFADAAAPIVMGIAGEDPFGAVLDQVLNGQRVKGRPFRVERFASMAAVRGCHLVFLNGVKMGGGRVEALTVSDSEDFCTRGGMVGLQIQGGRLVLEVNLAAVNRSGLRISAQLFEDGQDC